MKHPALSVVFLVTALLLPACQGTGASNARGLYDDLGGHHREVTTSSPLAQRWFDQGLVLLYAFNHDEAIRCFREAARLDPDCAMAWWGIAAANGPHINFPMVPPERDAAAREALARALPLVDRVGAVERDLIEAQSLRWGPAPVADRAPLDLAYAQAMSAVRERHPEDADVGTLCAEAWMDLQPWDMWTVDGVPKGQTLRIVEMLETALRQQPSNPGANHLYIHTMEASNEPGRATAAADRLRDLVPGAGHLRHMPAHIYIRTGRYADASQANIQAQAADEKHRARFPRDGFIQVYVAHNSHFLAFSSMMEGRSEAALAASRRMLADMPPEFVQANIHFADGFLPVVYHTLVRFGRWQEILDEPGFPEAAIVANGVRHYARGVALTALDRIDEARAELVALDAVLARLDDRPIGNNPARTVMKIPRLSLHGEIEFRAGNRQAAIELMQEAARLEDELAYDEPPDWMMPVRHPLGAMLLEAERWVDAEAAFRSDLRRFPGNGWSLFGLARALRAQGREDEARTAEQEFGRAWERADVRIQSPCMCQPGSGPPVTAAR